MRPRSLGAVALLVSSLVGCGMPPRSGAFGTVKTVTGCGPASSAVPVEGARVTLSCPDKPDILVATTDARGNFEAKGPAQAMPTDPRCELIVAKSGFTTRKFPLWEVCQDERRGMGPESSPDQNPVTCSLVGASALLWAAPAAKAATP